MKSPAPESAEITTTRQSRLPVVGGKYFALAILFSMNLLNYVDRYSFSSAGVHIKHYLHVDDFLFGWLGASFMIVYTIISPLMGWLGDRYNRKVLLASGVGLWSFATVGTAFSGDYRHMFFWRALLGVGEASYGVIAPALLSDLFPVKERGRAMGVYFLALPVGTALGFILGGTIADLWGWRAVFLVVGLPGLLAAAAGLLISDPGRGASEGGAPAGKGGRPSRGDYLELIRIPSFLYNTAGMAAVTFATGAYGFWGLIFYQRVHHLTATQAGTTIGSLMVVASLIGIALGTFLADVLYKFTKRAYLLLAALAVLCAIPLGATGILDPVYKSSLVFLFGASLLMSMVLGPCNTVTANVVPANRRAVAYAAFIFLIHLFGDISSQVILGWISDLFGKPSVANSWIGQFLASIGARPVDGTNLTAAMLSVVPVLALGCVFFLIGSRYLPRDQEKVRVSSSVDADHLAQFHH
jgi:MFS transporter, Spinster family, sphingosine-1-phosphate transporter